MSVKTRDPVRRSVLTVAFACATGLATAQTGAPNSEWPAIGGDSGHSKYSAIDQINATNARQLEIAWTWTSVDERIQKDHPDNPQIANATYFELTPIVIDGVLYGSTCLGHAFALDAGTGKTLWYFNSNSIRTGRPPNLGYISRGVAYKEIDGAGRVFFATNDSYLYALDAQTGLPVPSFGADGSVDLLEGIPRARRGSVYGHTSAPAICGDVVAVGSTISDAPLTKEGIPGRVKAFDVVTGAPRWTFNCVPTSGELGVETWEGDSWQYTGGVNVWAHISADEDLGYFYLPTSTPTNDLYGGHRLGDNLFGESLVCVNANTGERVWHRQLIHHGLWDYDLPCAPNLVDIVVDDRAIKAVAQATKHGFVFVFDRATGEPVWPIEERPVPASDVPGERASPTQPFPTKPEPFARQGVTENDLIDYTPELKAEALKIAQQYTFGPLFTPPSHEKPLLAMPSVGGGANWPGCAFDPETQMLYIPSMNWPSQLFVAPPDPARSNLNYARVGGPVAEGPRGLPLLKGPYGELIAMDLRTGTIAWRRANGGTQYNEHPALNGLNVPELGSNGRAAAIVTKTLLIATDGAGERSGPLKGGGGLRLRMFDKSTGEEVAAFAFSSPPTGVPMTYMRNGRQFIVVALGTNPAQLAALALPKEQSR